MRNIDTSYITNKGLRHENQDACVAKWFGDETLLLVVADGMGGAKGGEIASQTVVEIALETVSAEYSRPNFENSLKETLYTIVDASHEALAKIGRESSDLTGLGTTLVALIVHKGKYAFANIGDSRIYLNQHGTFFQITKDHSYLREYQEQNPGQEISEALISQYGHVVTHIIDGSGDLPDVYPQGEELYFNLNEGEAFILCSDGLILNRTDLSDYISYFFNTTTDLETYGERLISFAIENGSTDNISIVVMDNNAERKESSEIGLANVQDDKTIALQIPIKDIPKPKRNVRTEKKITYSLVSFLLVIVVTLFVYSWQTDTYHFKEKPSTFQSNEQLDEELVLDSLFESGTRVKNDTILKDSSKSNKGFEKEVRKKRSKASVEKSTKPLNSP